MKFFFDNNMSPYLAKAIGALCEPDKYEVVHLADKFPKNISDEEWMKALHNEGGWTIVSNDRFNKNSAEKEALRRSGFVAFILKKQWQDFNRWDQAYNLVRWWPRIIEQAGLVKNGAFFVPYKFSGKGKFEPIQ